MRRRRDSSPRERLLAVFVSLFLLSVVGSVFLLKSSVYSSEENIVWQAPTTFNKLRMIEECKQPLFMVLEKQTVNAPPQTPMPLKAHQYGKCDIGKGASLKEIDLGSSIYEKFVGDINNDGYPEIGLTHTLNSHILYLYSGKNGNLLGQVDAGGTIYELFGLGDVNGDSVRDIAIRRFTSAAPWQQIVRVYSGADFSLIEELHDPAVQQTGEQFGYYVATLGDLTGNGVSELGVTAPLYDGSSQDIGRFFIYSYNAGTSSFDRIHIIEGTSPSQRIGISGIGSLGDFNQDGNKEFYVAGDDIGKIYSYQGGFANVLSELVISSHQVNENSFAVFDFGGDGINELFVGQPNALSGGVIELFDSTFTTLVWSKLAPKILNGDQSSEQFGEKVLVLGDLTGDGISELLVSAPFTDQVYSHNSWNFDIKYKSGAVYILDVAQDEVVLRIPGDTVYQGFGHDIAVIE